ncbi:hypothetical protein EHN07_06275 [Buttiauxella warmboldiae]|uniref:Uncharacterized protein n=1 Tax=Buttiauxella warmboldiae TaxID=82993 RepID=A0A3N5EAB2_9ENTR|nr:helix-turn-helix domain-containing protein [Buttiauxella warmboldiae]RPH29253.1 hypothetical protein EHN07_06275 [Buttiauxella warmboldiae]
MSYNTSVKKLGEAISSSALAVSCSAKKKQRINWSASTGIRYLKKGTISVYRIDNGVKLFTLSAPYILGLPLMRAPKVTDFYRCDTDCEFSVVSVDEADRIFNESDLWEHAIEVMSFHKGSFFSRSAIMTTNNSDQIVYESLKVIHDMKEIEKNKTSIYSFIMERYPISRGTIYKIVNKLVHAGEIEIERGHLIRMNA